MLAIPTELKTFLEHRARQGQISEVAVTHREISQCWLEIELIKRFLHKEDRTLDVGCGNGYATRMPARVAKKIIGIDYS